MPLLTEAELDALTIERMIFHVVKPDSATPVYLAEVAPLRHAEFFVVRLRETLRGAAYLFAPGSGMPALLRGALPPQDGNDGFVGISRELADRFKVKVKTDKRHASGVLMLFLLRSGGEYFVAIVKYEHRRAISYSHLKDDQGTPILDASGNPVPDLQSFVDTFTEDKKAMQKSAFVRFARQEVADGEAMLDRIVIIDHSSGRFKDASQHFANFLDVRRAMEPTDMTKRLEEAAVEAIKRHKDEVPVDVARAPKRFVREAMARTDGFDHERPEEFLSTVTHGLNPDSQIIVTFKAKLEDLGIATEGFLFEGARPPRAEYRRVVTNDSVVVLFSKEHEEQNKVKITDIPNGGVEITVRSTGLVWNDEIEKLPKIAG